MFSDSTSTPSRLTATSEDDARLYALVHDALEKNATPSERRDGKRGNFTCQQLVAPYAGGAFPDQADFQHVECCDLSTAGFSFLTNSPPDTDRLIVALGRVPFNFFIAEIANRKPLMLDGQRTYRVGCQFRQRIER